MFLMKNQTVEDETHIIKKICDDVKTDYMNDVEATPEILISYLKESIEEYNAVQEQCMEHFAVASTTFKGSMPLYNLSIKFMNVNEKAIAFVSKQLVQPTINKNMVQSHLQNAKGKNLWNWVNSDTTDCNRVIFKWKEVRGCTKDFQSLCFGETVMSSIIDIWSALLNNNNKKEPHRVKNRFFCFTHNTVGIINASKKIPQDKLYAVFAENMEYTFDLFGVSFDKIDLIFFPMLILNHQYIVCYNLQEPALDIIDNKKSEKTFGDLYDDQITILHQYFCKFIEERGHKKAINFHFVIPERLEMPWQTKYNDVDCGVFVILHMESYMGCGPVTWHTNIYNESYKQMIQINDLRVRYTCSALTSDYNENRLILSAEYEDKNSL